jgi:hypothetical protein
VNKGESVRSKWIKRAGAAGFVFFFVKGLVWLGIAGGIAVASW